MNCPACSEGLIKGQDRCPRCGTVVFLPVEGALAPDPNATPQARNIKTEPMREIPGLKKRERTWKDEVRERVRDRRQSRSGAGDLPLFREEEPALEEPVPVAAVEAPAIAVDDLPLRPLESPLPPASPVAASPAPAPRVAAPPRSIVAPRPPAAVAPAPVARTAEPAILEDDDAEEEWPLDSAPRAEAIRPVERPARVLERGAAGALDLAILGGLCAVVVYFAARAAHVSVPALLPAWPFLAGYLCFLGLLYAGYFTGTTGQTVGKIVAGLRVVDGAGNPPGFLKALLRAALGSLSVALAGLGAVPMALDPAGRGVHDRLLKTRVVKF